MATIQDVLYQYRNIYADGKEQADGTGLNRQKGTWFEQLCLWFFKHDPLYRQRFSEVWMWSDWPGRDGRLDTGIDLVASVRDGGYCAIQCKFFEPGHSVQKADIDSFLALSGQEGFTERLIVSVADDWSANAENAIENQQIPCTRLTLEDLDASRLDWGAFDLNRIDSAAYRPAKTLRPDQEKALKAVLEGFQEHDRGKLIMACGTGKTFTSLKIAECLTGPGKTVLFLVPSISLLNQTLLAWNADSSVPLISLAVCSDATVGRRRTTDEDMKPTDLACPPTTSAQDLLRVWRAQGMSGALSSMTVVFSTYQSLSVLTEAQKMGLPDFDLVICDEAHRTTGVTLTGTDESNFVRVHQNKFIRGTKRLYMTATPRIFSASATARAQEVGAILCDMNDPSLYGPEFHRLSFSEAVRLDLLSDYKVMVLIVDQRYVSDAVTQIMAEGELKLDDAVKIIGCWKGLAKELASTSLTDRGVDPTPMRTAVAFSSSIANSEQFRDSFPKVIEEFKKQAQDGAKSLLNCEVRHVDGKDNICKRNALLEWLKSDQSGIQGPVTEKENAPQCRILSNARCLSEGVDIPALDAVLFLNPRKSKVDVVQSVGRVMRKAPGKKFGYVIIPVMIPSGVAPEDALDRNNNFKVVWEVLQALRAHDDQFNAEVNSLDLNGGSDKVIVDVIGLPEQIDGGIDIPFPPEAWQDGVYAGIVKRCGDRQYWDQWARDMAAVAEVQTTRLKSLIEQEHSAVQGAFEAFLTGLKENINNNVSRDDALDMLAQHLITKPVFDAIFGSYHFSEQNPVSQAMERIMKELESCGLESETEALSGFYESVKERISVINNDAGRQKVIKDLYETFFQTAFPRTADRLGIVYTPIEVVDFILRSADWALRSELACPEGLSAPDVHVLDPFTGTGTFLVRLLQLGLIAPEALARKYSGELHANEILLLAYYIAAINIEAAYHAALQTSGAENPSFEPFPGIVLTDTFNLYNKSETSNLDMTFPENSARAEAQRKTPITVIVGNPPYSVGQESANDNNQNLAYPELDQAITDSYVAQSNAHLRRNLYDSYIRAIRWASDRIEGRGLICYVTNGSFLDSNSADGLRKCLCQEFQSIYVFNLRGNQYTSGERSRKEGGKIFGSGSRLPVAITLLVKDPERAAKGEPCRLYYRDIGDYLTREDKLAILSRFQSVGAMKDAGHWTVVTPNEAGDWINPRSEAFHGFLRLGNKNEPEQFALYEERYSLGVSTNRDAWCYNFSRDALERNMIAMIRVYNEERERWHKSSREGRVQDFVNNNSEKIAWSRSLYTSLKRDIQFDVIGRSFLISLYRPYVKSHLYFDRKLNEMVCLMPSIFPTPEAENRVICVTGVGSNKPFSALMTDCIPNLHTLDTGQAFPLYWYEESQSPEDRQGRFLDATGEVIEPGEQARRYIRRSALSEKALSLFREHYRDTRIEAEDVFYYVYGVLHSPEYRERFGDDVRRMLARVPLTGDFWAFSRAGKTLGALHLGYETAEPWPLTVRESDALPSGACFEDVAEYYRVEKMTFLHRGDRSAVRYNPHIVIEGIPERAWGYIVNGKSALDWVMERYQDKTDRDSQLHNDPNAWGLERHDPRYILDLFGRVVRVSMETLDIVEKLPNLEGETVS